MKNKLTTQTEEYNFDINKYNVKWIKSFDEFIQIYTSKKTWRFNWKYNSVKEKLYNLSDILKVKFKQEIDPVEYLIYLYFDQKISIIDISNNLKKLWISYPKSSLYNLYHNVLDLELRDRLEQTPSRKLKDINKWENNIFNKEKIEETQKAIDEILLNNKWINRWFKLIEYSKQKNITNKIIYLLYSLSFIKEENIDSLYKFINKLHNWWLWTHRIKNVLETIINNNIIKNNNLKLKNIKVDSKDIWNILQQQKNS